MASVSLPQTSSTLCSPANLDGPLRLVSDAAYLVGLSLLVYTLNVIRTLNDTRKSCLLK